MRTRPGRDRACDRAGAHLARLAAGVHRGRGRGAGVQLAAQRAIFSSGWALMSLSECTVLYASASTSPSGLTSSDPYGASPAARPAAASSIARRVRRQVSLLLHSVPAGGHRRQRMPRHLGVPGLVWVDVEGVEHGAGAEQPQLVQVIRDLLDRALSGPPFGSGDRRLGEPQHDPRGERRCPAPARPRSPSTGPRPIGGPPA